VVPRQLSLFGSCASAGEYPACLELIAAGKVDVDSMISKIVPLAEGDLWMKKVYRREDGLAKIVYLCDEQQ
jgi:threonine dehydrogenase-like Zn-dependent dehydrogenase